MHIFNKRTYYECPLCETEEHQVPVSILTGSELTDDGAGDFLVPGEEYTF